MPRRKKDPSTRARRNKASTAAKLTRISQPTVAAEAYSDLTVVQLRTEIDRRNGDGREDSALIAKRGAKASLVAALVADDGPKIPKLPEHPPRYDAEGQPVPVSWHPQTSAWWRDVWSSPMAIEWDDSDIHNVFVVALLYNDIWAADSAKGRKDALAEYRLQRADLGLSPYSRRRLEWTIETATEAKERGEKRRGNGRQTAPPPAAAAGPDPRLHLLS